MVEVPVLVVMRTVWVPMEEAVTIGIPVVVLLVTVRILRIIS